LTGAGLVVEMAAAGQVFSHHAQLYSLARRGIEPFLCPLWSFWSSWIVDCVTPLLKWERDHFRFSVYLLQL